MKLILKNFRCYIEKEFDFGEEGLVLLSGPSGAGKSTVFMAINFVLYGSGTKLVTSGKTSCMVELITDQYSIKRTKKPNRLVVSDLINNIEYEDDAGESFIAERYGKNFDTCSYIRQNAIDSFILMSPTEKLAFLEKFSFGDLDLSQIKGRCQALIKKRNEELISISSKLDTTLEYFNTLTKPEKVKPPKKGDINELKTTVNNKLVKYKEYHEISLKNLEKVKDKKRRNEVNKERASLRDYEICELGKSIDETKIKLRSIKVDDIKIYEDRLQKLKEYKDYIILKKRYNDQLNRYEELKKQEDEKLQIINNLKGDLWKDFTESECKEQISLLKEYIADLKKMDALTKELQTISIKDTEELRAKSEEIKNEIETLNKKIHLQNLSKNVYKCPSCKSSLRLENDNLLIWKETIEEHKDYQKDLVRLKSNLKAVENDINREEINKDRKNRIVKNIETIKNSYDSNDTLQDTIESLSNMEEYYRENLVKGQNLKNLTSNLVKLTPPEKFIERDIIEVNDDEEELKHIIWNNKKNMEELEKNKNMLKNLEEKLKTKLQDEDIKVFDDTELDAKIVKYESEIEKYNTQYNRYKNILEDIIKYEKYLQEYSIYKEWEDKVKKLKVEESTCKKSYAAATTLKEKILQAESISITNIVNSINLHAQEYLDLFFPDNPINIRLSTFKETKKSTKPQINLEIEYKSLEIDITMLSGGELSRVILAFTLALSEMFNSPILMLDECTSSLDQDLTSTVIEGLKKNFSNRLVIIIAHQVVSGVFDREINL